MNLIDIFTYQMRLVSFSGTFIWLGIILVFFTAYLFYRQERYLEISFIFISVFSYFYSVTIKGLFKIPRPDSATLSAMVLDRYSFPSTHVVTYTVIFGFLYYLVNQKYIKDKLLRNSLKITFAYLIVLVGISRVFLGQHFVRDVLFGYLFGAIFLSLQIFLYNRFREAMAKNQKNNG